MTVELLIQKIKKHESDIKAINYTVRNLTPKPEDLEQLKKQRKELSKQIKEIQEEIEREMNEDTEIQDLKKRKIEADEKIAELKQDLFAELKRQNKDFSVDVDCEDHVVKVQGVKSVRVFLNGKELVNKNPL